MITPRDLLSPDPRLRRFASKPEMDPLTEGDALQEAELLDVRLDTLRSTVGLLFDLRLAQQLREGNTGVLVARGVRALSWIAEARSTAKTAWTVMGSTPCNEDQIFGLQLDISPDAELHLKALSASFFSGDVPGLDRIPDYADNDESRIRAHLPGWHSDFVPVHAVFLDATPTVS